MASTITIVIVGPTAAGKSDLAIRIAERFNGEIIAADSRTIYRGMTLGTAKPSTRDMKLVRHHLVDIVDPGQTLSAAEFKALASEAADDIRSRGKIPIIVGGSGLYIDSYIYDYQFPTRSGAFVREDLEKKTLAQLLQLLSAKVGEHTTIDVHNRRRVIRALETVGARADRRKSPLPGVIMLGLWPSKEIAQERIRRRIQAMIRSGLLDEIKTLGQKYGWESSAMEVIGYRALKQVVLGTKTLDEGMAEFEKADLGLFKKQVTWFKRDKHILWLEFSPDAEVVFRQAEGLVQAKIESHGAKGNN